MTHMTRELMGPVKRLAAYVGEDELYGDIPIWRALVEQARKLGSAGATVVSCLDGYGAGSRLVQKHGLRMSSDRPVIVEVVDEHSTVTALGEVWSTMMESGLITVEDVSVVFYKGDVPEAEQA